uniref:Uncharacterized protein n=1 Tax=Arundo donax TaxID=35708 RepID=A0A0A9VIW2_ARUDO
MCGCALGLILGWAKYCDGLKLWVNRVVRVLGCKTQIT